MVRMLKKCNSKNGYVKMSTHTHTHTHKNKYVKINEWISSRIRRKQNVEENKCENKWVKIIV